MEITESCERKRALIAEYERTTSAFSRSVMLLQRNSGVLPKIDYERIRESAETARRLSEQARRNLDEHVAEHGC